MAAGERPPRDVLMQLTEGYQVSQAIHVAATLGIADLLMDGPRSVGDLAEATGSHPPTLYRLLRALASVGVFVEVDGRFGLTPPAEYLCTDTPGSVRAWAMYTGQPYTWSTWAHLLRSVRNGEPAFPAVHGTSVWEYRATHPEESATFDAAMTAISGAGARAIIRSYDFSGIGVLVDVGGGQGELLAAILAANPSLRGILFDLPHVVAGATSLLQEADIAERCEVVGGSFFDAVPHGADAYLLKSVIHDWEDQSALEILRQCRVAMADTSRLLLAEGVMLPGNEPDAWKFRDLQMLVMVGGRERTGDDFRQLCAAAGFRLTSITPTASPISIIEAVPV